MNLVMSRGRITAGGRRVVSSNSTATLVEIPIGAWWCELINKSEVELVIVELTIVELTDSSRAHNWIHSGFLYSAPVHLGGHR